MLSSLSSFNNPNNLTKNHKLTKILSIDKNKRIVISPFKKLKKINLSKMSVNNLNSSTKGKKFL